jgi:hypothetical protein
MLIMKTRGMNMNNKIMGGLLGLLSLFTACAANAATVTVNPASQTVAAGSTFQLTLSGSDFLDGVTGGSALLSWDPASVALNTTATDLILGTGVGSLGPSFTDLLAFSTTANSVDLTAVVSLLLPPVGQGGATFDFVALDFTALAPPGSAISINLGSGGNWQDGNGLDVTGVVFTGATVTVTPNAVVPVPAAAWLFASGLLGLVGVARRRA